MRYETGSVRPAAGSSGLLSRAFAVFMALHGVVHVFGFTSKWGLGGPKGLDYTSKLLNGSVDVGDTAAKLVGLVWLAAAFAFVAVAVMIWQRHPWAKPATYAVLIGSLVLCVVALPAAVIGLVIDVVLLGLMLVASERLIAVRTNN